MAYILCLETATTICSVTLFENNRLISFRETDQKNAHSEFITSFIKEVVEEADIDYLNIDAVAVSKGPGSYTGLRIGVSTAKGLCYALDKPLIAISTLQSMAAGFTNHLMSELSDVSEDTLFCPMIDARRMEVYTAVYDIQNREIESVNAKIIDPFSFQDHLKKHKVCFFGDGAEKCHPILSLNHNAVFIDNFHPSATMMNHLAFESFQNGNFEDVDYFEPYYLKDFIAGIPKVKGLK